MKNKTTSSLTHTTCHSPPHAERGVSLIVVLMFVFAISGITIWAARQAMLGEGMARNQLDMEVARQAAETALRDAERDIMNMNDAVLTNASCSRGRDRPPQATDFTATCARGLCIANEAVYAASTWNAATVTEPWWPTGRGGRWNNDFSTKPSREPVNNNNCNNFTGGVPLGTFTGMAAIKGVAVQPEYLIEYFRRSSSVTYQPTNYYRITARGFGYRLRTQVVLQTIFVPLQE